MLDPSNFTLAPNGAGSKTPSPGRGPSPGLSSASLPGSAASGSGFGSVSGTGTGGGERYVVQDSRWRFHGEEHFPKPRNFVGGARKYRAGRGSSVPLHLGAL
ncbi:uncharacterized protein C8A04DRAFT_13720 [Dichotomopilus funicola]|uniref:Uncharacterized protein n=1 Tax=Dichotomopilus funicola TaxID=1934379 RepID=A0AAN6ZLQ0_9PEZI|nr:hypothetical protein C8A04DRAFT_13720 [Dichotomopilus funicola]